MEVCGQIHAPAALPRERTPVPTEQAAGWAPDPARTFWRGGGEKSLAFAGIRTLERPAHILLTVPTMPSRLPYV
jgi:hypothetical protein